QLRRAPGPRTRLLMPTLCDQLLEILGTVVGDCGTGSCEKGTAGWSTANSRRGEEQPPTIPHSGLELHLRLESELLIGFHAGQDLMQDNAIGVDIRLLLSLPGLACNTCGVPSRHIRPRG